MRILSKFRSLWLKSKLEAEMAEEMRLHLELQTELNVKAGMKPDDARYAALRQFGNVAKIQEQAREGRGWVSLENLIKDFCLGVRSLLKTPRFTVIAIITLGLGIGANTAMFSMLNGVILKPLPYADSGRLDAIYRATAQKPDGGVSPADFRDLKQEIAGYGDVAAYSAGDTSLAAPGEPAEFAPIVHATANFFSLLGIRPHLGRDFRSDEDVSGRDRVLIISHRCWQNRFGGRADIIGRIARVDGEPHEIIGVLPVAFNDWRHLGWVDLFRPLGLDPEKSSDRHTTSLQLLGRRSDRNSPVEGNAFIAGFGVRLAADFPDVHAQSTWLTVPLNRVVVGQEGPVVLGMLVGLSGFVLLIACSNLANFLLARTMARAREFALRSALGASRTQLLRPLFTESLLLALAGGGLALLFAQWVADFVAMRSTDDNGESVVFTLDWSVLGWAFAVSLVTALAFGIAPALFALRLDLNHTLKSGGRGSSGDRSHHRFRQFLIVSQFALAMVLLAGAVLFVRGLDELNHRRSGWESENLVTGTVLLPAAHYGDAEKISQFHRLTLQQLEALPGVASASISTVTPFFDGNDIRKFLVDGHELPEPGREPAAVINAISPRYLETLGTRLLAGRTFAESDSPTAPRVYLINQAMAQGLFGEKNPIGRRIAQTGSDKPQWGEIVGVVADVRSVLPDAARVKWQLYTPMAQEAQPRFEIAVRTAGAQPEVLVDGIRQVMTELAPDLPIRKLQAADATIYRANYQLGVLRDLLASFAVLGLGLAVLGIYGVIARTVAQRNGEFAIRLALGASAQDITRLVLSDGVKLALMGAALGLVGAVGVARLLASGFTGMHLEGADVILAVTALLIVVALLACWLPARRAAKVDPIVALRAE